jgi:flagellar hook-basal body complex protein FliE
MTAPISAIATRAMQGAEGVLGAGDTRAIKVPVTGTSGAPPIGTTGPSFGDLFTRAINQVSAAQDKSSDYVAAFLRGEPVELHQVMAASEEAGISVDMLIQVRNKFLEAYKTVTSMQG